MKVLFVSPTVPWPPDSGGRIRTAKLIAAAGRRAEVHVRAIAAPSDAADAAAGLSSSCASLRVFGRGRSGLVRSATRSKIERWFHSPELERALEVELATEDFDVVHLDEMCLARALSPRANTPTVMHHHKLDTELWEQLAGERTVPRFDLWKLRRLERYAARRYHHHLFCSHVDARALAERHPGIDCTVVENGFDAEYFARCEPTERARDRLLFLGTMSYAPNVDAARWFVEAILPGIRAERPEVELDIVGNDPAPAVTALARPGVRVVGSVTDVRPWLQRAAALVVPLRVGGGSRVKLIEALALGTPVVTTRVGVEGLGFQHGAHLRVADEPAPFAATVLDLLSSPGEAAALGERGRVHAWARYRWSELAAKLTECWERVAQS